MNIEDCVTARYEKGGKRFEVLIDPKGAEEFHEKGAEFKDLGRYLPIDAIFKDAKKGDRAATDSLKETFGTTEVLKIAKYILENGEIQLTTEQRREMLEKKMQRVVTEIARNAVDPRTMAPHPPERIKRALDEGHFRVDLNKGIPDQVEEAMKILRPIMPIKFEKIKIAVKIPADYSAKAYAHLHHYAIEKEEWQKDGSLIAVIEIPAGMQTELYDELNSFTRGNVETKIIK